MTYYESIKEKIATGYIIFCTRYVRPIEAKVYSIQTPKVDGSCTHYADIAYNIAKKLEKETGSKIIYDENESVALNYRPEPVKPNCVRTFHQDVVESIFH
jgi:hypothetical protein